MRACAHCRHPLDGYRSHARFCSDRCRKRAHRRRQVDLPESAYPDGASRGHVPLGDPLSDRELLRAAEATFPRAV